MEPVTGEVRGRQALYGGLLGAVGVVLAWVVWVLVRALFDKWALGTGGAAGHHPLQRPAECVDGAHKRGAGSHCKDLRLGSQSGLLRSWLVLGVFSLGLGAAYTLEARLRPQPYTGSGTQQRDFYLSLIALLLLLAAVVAVRFRLVV